MMLNKFISVLEQAQAQHELNVVDLVVLNDIAVNGEGTIMKIVSRPKLFASATRHEHIKKLCERGFLNKKEVPGNMRFKTISLSDKATGVLKQLEGVDA